MLFSHLVPALLFNATVYQNIPIGNISTGPGMLYGQVISGTLTSEPGFETSINGTVLHAGDYVLADPDRQVIRLNIQGLVKTDDTPPAYLQMTGTGIEIPTPKVLATIDGLPGAGTVNYGDFQAVTVWSFAAGNTKYKNLEDSVFVGSTAVRPGIENGTFVVGFQMAKVYSTQTNVTI